MRPPPPPPPAPPRGLCVLAALLCLGLSLPQGPSSAASSSEGRLLKALGLRPRARPHKMAPVPPLLWRIFRRRQSAAKAEEETACRMEEFGVPGNVLRAFPDQGDPPQGPEPGLCLQKRLFFDLSALDVAAGEVVTAARLELHFGQNRYGAASPSPSGAFDLRLFRDTGGALALRRRPLLSQSFLHVHKSFAFDVTPAATAGRPSLGLALEVGAEGGLCAGLGPFREAALFVVSLSAGRCREPRREKRGAGHVAGGSGVCKARRLYIGFGDVGWEGWVIAPQGYQANYCLGECPFPLAEELNGTNHAILQTIVHSLDPRGTPQPCCVPVRLSPISLLYYDNDDNVVLRHYEDMVVDECGCR